MATVLLVDDDVDIIKTCEMAITQHGHEVKAANSAEEARQLFSETKPDVIILDVMMETKTAGFEFAREVHSQCPELPIIMLTSIHEEVPVSMRFGPDETWLPVVKFLDKPIDPVVLANEIDAVLAK